MLQFATRIGIHHKYFFMDKFISKNCLWRNYFLIKIQDYCQRPKFLLNSVIDVFLRVFWNRCTKNFGNYPEKKYVGEFPFDKFARLRPTAYRTRKSTTDAFLVALGKLVKSKGVIKFQKFLKGVRKFLKFHKDLRVKISLHVRISDFNKIRLKEKCFLWLLSEIVVNLSGEGL